MRSQDGPTNDRLERFDTSGRLDRLVAILGGQETIRDFIAFPKNNAGRDVMIDAPAPIDDEQLNELNLSLKLNS